MLFPARTRLLCQVHTPPPPHTTTTTTTSRRVLHLIRRVLHLMRCFENESSTSRQKYTRSVWQNYGFVDRDLLALCPHYPYQFMCTLVWVCGDCKTINQALSCSPVLVVAMLGGGRLQSSTSAGPLCYWRCIGGYITQITTGNTHFNLQITQRAKTNRKKENKTSFDVFLRWNQPTTSLFVVNSAPSKHSRAVHFTGSGRVRSSGL